MSYPQTCGKLYRLILRLWRLGRISRHFPATNGFAGLSPLKPQRREKNMLAESFRNLRKGCAALAVGMAVFTGRIKH